MKRYRILVVLSLIGVSSLIVAAKYGDPPCYNLEGPWVASHAPGSPLGSGPHFLVTYHAMGNSGDQYSFDVDGLVGDPTVWHPAATSLTAFHGIFQKTGRNRFESSSIGYVLDAAGQVLLISNVHTAASFTSCDTQDCSATCSLYLPAQDANQDGIPDEGQQPIQCVPVNWIITRITMTPPCVLEN